MTAAEVRFGVLGPLLATAADEPLPLGGRVQRAMLGALLLHVNEPVSADRLIECVWGERPPPSATHAVSVYVSKLRKALGEESITRAHGGYVLRVVPGRLDVDRFEALVASARQKLALGDSARASALLDDALALWRGPALADLELESFAQAAIARLEELRLAARITRCEALLASQRQHEAIPELEALLKAHPYDERICSLLMVALYRAGRQADALGRYQGTRIVLADELGLEPSASLQDLEGRILSRDATLELEPSAELVRSVVVVPRRAEDLEALAVLTAPFGLSRNPHEVILTWIEPPGPAKAVSAALAEASTLLARLRDDLVAQGARARVATFTAESPSEDVLALARRPEVDLVVLGRRLAELDDGRFEADLASIVSASPCDVALWFSGDGPARLGDGPVLVPFGGTENDWAALELGAWIASTTGRSLVLVGMSRDSAGERRDASRMLADAGLLIQRVSGIVAHPRLTEPGTDGLLDAFSDAGLVLAGLSDRWSSAGLGATRLARAKSATAPVLFLRRGLRPGGLSPPEGVTLYRWSVTAAA
jgi:DNA-binding SARP family transcriptional activator